VFEQGFNAIADRYARLLQIALRNRGIVLVGTAATVALAFVLYRNLKQELIPDDDRGFFLVVASAPEGSSLDYTDGYVRQIEQIIGKTPDVQGYFTIIGGFAGGVNRAFVGVILKDWSERHTTVPQLVGGLFPQLFGIAGVRAFPYSPGALGFSQPVQFVVQNPDFARLGQVMDTFATHARAIKGLTNVDRHRSARQQA
jgi:multidrug efflux pump